MIRRARSRWWAGSQALLRASLDPSRSALVPLADELRTVRDYLDIERVRFGDRLRYELPSYRRAR